MPQRTRSNEAATSSRASSLLAFALAAAGCGPTDFRGYCEHSSASLCQATFRCYTDQARAQWGNITACTEDLKVRVGCAESRFRRCAFDPAATSRCLDDIDNLPCETTFELPASCQLECREP